MEVYVFIWGCETVMQCNNTEAIYLNYIWLGLPFRRIQTEYKLFFVHKSNVQMEWNMLAGVSWLYIGIISIVDLYKYLNVPFIFILFFSQHKNLHFVHFFHLFRSTFVFSRQNIKKNFLIKFFHNLMIVEKMFFFFVF